MIKHVFLFGVIIPTSVTILFFIGFLVCWFKFNIKERFFKKHFCKWHLKSNLATSTHGQDTSLPANVTYNRNHTHSDHTDHHDPHGHDPDTDHQGQAVFPYNTHTRYTLPPKARQIYEFDSELCSNCSVAGDLESGQCQQPFSSQPDIHDYKEKDICASQPHSPQRTLPPQPNLQVTIGPSVQGLIQQTFHFPITSGNQLKCIPLDRAEDHGNGEDGNYGHFLPKSCMECGESQCPTTTTTTTTTTTATHPSTLQETHFPIDKAHCVLHMEPTTAGQPGVMMAYSGVSDDSQCGSSEYSGSDISGIHLIASSSYHAANIPNVSG